MTIKELEPVSVCSVKLTGNEPTYPCPSDLHGKQHNGLTIKEQFAMAALQGIMANGHLNYMSDIQKATYAVVMAGHLIDALNNETELKF